MGVSESDLCTHCEEFLDHGNPMIVCDSRDEFKKFCNEDCWFDHLNGLEKAQVMLERRMEVAHV